MIITQLELNNFRCFSHRLFTFNQSLVLIEGPNGVGKTSLLEALYTAAFKRSFRTAITRDLICHRNNEAFTIKVKGLTEEEPWELFLGYSPQQMIYKLNNTPTTFAQVIMLYKPIVVTEDDMVLVKGFPGGRRTFLDQTLCLLSSDYLKILRHYKKSLEARNALLQTTVDYKTYCAWSEQFWHYASLITQERKALLERFEQHIKEQSQLFLNNLFTARYVPAYELRTSYEEFMEKQSALYEKEKHAQRSLWGPHLDEVIFFIGDKNVRDFASRGMQKILVLLLKITQASLLDKKVIFLVDDFFLDLDKERLQRIITLFKELGSQAIITTPVGFPYQALFSSLEASYQHLNLTY